MSRVPYVGFGNDVLSRQPTLRIGDQVACPHCGKRHRVKGATNERGEVTDLLLYYKCGKTPYLAGVRGRSIMRVRPEERISGVISS